MSNSTLSDGQGYTRKAVCSGGNPLRFCLAWMGIVWLGLALSGCKERQVARDTSQMEADSRFWIRVLLLKSAAGCTVQVPQGFTVKAAAGQALPKPVNVKKASKGLVSIPIRAKDGQITMAERAYAARELELWPGRPHTFSLNQRQYRGRMKVIVADDGSSINLINLVPLEAYLAGVVGAEMPAFWHVEALKVQAVIARTYCLHIKQRFGRTRSWDLNKGQAHQVYQGLDAEHPRIWDAVNQTKGQCLTGQGPDKAYTIFPTYYSAICGGHTENSERVFGDSFVPLSGVTCSYCQDVAKLGQYLWPMAQYPKKTVSDKILRRYSKLRSLERIVELAPAEQSEYEGYARITSFKLTGVNGKTDYLRAEDLRLTVDPSGREIQSTMCRIADWGDQWAFIGGRGWGHGVGLCQCGAQGLAKRGSTYQAILQHYYPGSRIINIYD
jgi:stage II sporulation protein D